MPFMVNFEHILNLRNQPSPLGNFCTYFVTLSSSWRPDLVYREWVSYVQATREGKPLLDVCLSWWESILSGWWEPVWHLLLSSWQPACSSGGQGWLQEVSWSSDKESFSPTQGGRSVELFGATVGVRHLLFVQHYNREQKCYCSRIFYTFRTLDSSWTLYCSRIFYCFRIFYRSRKFYCSRKLHCSRTS